MTAAYCSYCDADADADAGQGGVCARCGNRRGSLFPAVLTPEQVEGYRAALERCDWRDVYLQRPEPRDFLPPTHVDCSRRCRDFLSRHAKPESDK